LREAALNIRKAAGRYLFDETWPNGKPADITDLKQVLDRARQREQEECASEEEWRNRKEKAYAYMNNEVALINRGVIIKRQYLAERAKWKKKGGLISAIFTPSAAKEAQVTLSVLRREEDAELKAVFSQLRPAAQQQLKKRIG
jgi:hypothetical protein